MQTVQRKNTAKLRVDQKDFLIGPRIGHGKHPAGIALQQVMWPKAVHGITGLASADVGKAGSDFLHIEGRLFPSCEMTALFQFIPMDDVFHTPLGPTTGRAKDFFGIDANPDGQVEIGAGETSEAFPIESG